MKKSLGQNFLIDRNITKKICNLINFKNKNVLEIGPGNGALTEEILKKKPKSLTLIEKDDQLISFLKKKYSSDKSIKIICSDILKFDLTKIKKDKLIILGNLPYNISSQILVKILKNLSSKFIIDDLVLMFQKELGEKIIGQFKSKSYGRLSIITNLKLYVLKKFLFSSNCFLQKPNVTSMVIHFKIKKTNKFNIKQIDNLEKVTNILFSNKRKMINKNIKKILNKEKLTQIPKLKLNLRPEEIHPEIYYKITELFEEK